MRFYTRQHTSSCGFDLHARTMYVCIVDGEGEGTTREDRSANYRCS
jgi:hypothetical protein